MKKKPEDIKKIRTIDLEKTAKDDGIEFNDDINDAPSEEIYDN
jgi:hypothetical protein